MRLNGNFVEHRTNSATFAYAPGPKQSIFSVYCEYSQAARAVGSDGLLRRGKVRSQQTWDLTRLTIQMMPGDTAKGPTQGLWSFWSLLYAGTQAVHNDDWCLQSSKQLLTLQS